MPKRSTRNNAKGTIGYLINIGITTMRAYSVSPPNLLKEIGGGYTYDADPEDKEKYCNNIIELVNRIAKTTGELPIKVIVDSKFAEIFENDSELSKFIWDFYAQTNLYFNILTEQQTEKNLTNLFGDICGDTIIVNIGSRYVEILLIKKFSDGSLNIESAPSIRYSLKDIDNLRRIKNVGEIWTSDEIQELKRSITHNISKAIMGIKAVDAIIIKGELTFMSVIGYPLVVDKSLSELGSVKAISFESYRNSNCSLLFEQDFPNVLKKLNLEEERRKRYLGFKNGHLLLETIFEKIGIRRIIPSDLLNIHGSEGYVYNVVLSGSTSKTRAMHLFEGAELVKKQFGEAVNIVSPYLDTKNRTLNPITKQTIYEHFQAIENCDLLFVCNKDGHIGISTAIEIGYASAKRKTIAFWQHPSDEIELSSIPQEQWDVVKILSKSQAT